MDSRSGKSETLIEFVNHMKNTFSKLLSVVNLNRKWRFVFLCYVILAFVIAISELGLVAFVADFLSERLGGASRFTFLLPTLITPGYLVVILALWVGLIRVIFTKATAWFTFSLGREILNTIFSKIIDRPFGASADQLDSQLAFLTSKVDMVIHGLVLPCLNIISGMLIGSIFLAFLISTSVELTFYACAMLSLAYIVPSMISKGRLKIIAETLSQQLTILINQLKIGIYARRDIKLWRMERYFESKVQSLTLDIAQARETAYVWSLIPRVLIESTIYIGIGFFLIYSKESNLGDGYIYITFALASIKLLPSMQQVYYSWTNLRVGDVVTDELSGYLEIPDLARTEEDVSDAFESLVMQNVSFGYGDEHQILSSFNFEVMARDKIVLFGESGTGKSTILDLISGLVKPDTGRLLINGSPLSSGVINSYVAYISQTPFIFNKSLRDNVTLSFHHTEGIDESRLQLALEASGVTDYLAQNSMSLDYVVGENGDNLSGGQAQRLAIARALYSKKEIILLDEITSALDGATSKKIIDSILEIEATVILITHDRDIYDRFPRKISIKQSTITENKKLD
jgi:ABC-type bacteriocin/lantibiotic exporter with double-glycine peptidase domain